MDLIKNLKLPHTYYYTRTNYYFEYLFSGLKYSLIYRVHVIPITPNNYVCSSTSIEY